MINMGANEAIVEELAKYIEDNIPEFNSVLREWPNHNESLDMPCATILTVGSPDYTQQMPVLSKSEGGISTYIVGFYDINLHIDIWAEYKALRGDMMEKVIDLFNKQFQESGMALGASLTLADYDNVIARYDLGGYTYMDSEESSQRDEWRAKVVVLVNCPRIMTKIESKMEDIKLYNNISTNNDSDTDEILTIEE